jgi:hypothetical protein
MQKATSVSRLATLFNRSAMLRPSAAFPENRADRLPASAERLHWARIPPML